MEYPGGLSFNESEKLIREADYKINGGTKTKPKVIELHQKPEIKTTADNLNLEVILSLARTTTVAIIIYVILSLIFGL